MSRLTLILIVFLFMGSHAGAVNCPILSNKRIGELCSKKSFFGLNRVQGESLDENGEPATLYLDKCAFFLFNIGKKKIYGSARTAEIIDETIIPDDNKSLRYLKDMKIDPAQKGFYELKLCKYKLNSNDAGTGKSKQAHVFIVGKKNLNQTNQHKTMSPFMGFQTKQSGMAPADHRLSIDNRSTQNFSRNNFPNSQEKPYMQRENSYVRDEETQPHLFSPPPYYGSSHDELEPNIYDTPTDDMVSQDDDLPSYPDHRENNFGDSFAPPPPPLFQGFDEDFSPHTDSEFDSQDFDYQHSEDDGFIAPPPPPPLPSKSMKPDNIGTGSRAEVSREKTGYTEPNFWNKDMDRVRDDEDFSSLQDSELDSMNNMDEGFVPPPPPPPSPSKIVKQDYRSAGPRMEVNKDKSGYKEPDAWTKNKAPEGGFNREDISAQLKQRRAAINDDSDWDNEEEDMEDEFGSSISSESYTPPVSPMVLPPKTPPVNPGDGAFKNSMTPPKETPSRSKLLEQIQKGATLKKVEPSQQKNLSTPDSTSGFNTGMLDKLKQRQETNPTNDTDNDDGWD